MIGGAVHSYILVLGGTKYEVKWQRGNSLRGSEEFVGPVEDRDRPKLGLPWLRRQGSH